MKGFYEHMKKRKFIPLLPVLCVILLLCLISGAYARYTHDETKGSAVSGGKFYFTSDFLSEEGASYTLAENTTELTIELRNYADDLRWTDEKISYKYQIDSGEEQTGTIASGEKKTSTIKLQGLTAGRHTVTVTSTTPFVTVLKGTFTIPEKDDSFACSVQDSANSPYVLVTVTTKEYTGNITLSWPAGIFPDSTQNDIFASIDTWNGSSYSAGSVTIAAKANSAYVYRFFKEDISKNYSNSSEIKVGK